MTLASLNRTRRIENLAIVAGLLFLIAAGVSRPYMEQPRPISCSVRG